MDIAAAEANRQDLHVLIFPMGAKGHMIPALDMATMFSARGVRTTIVTTPLNAPFFRRGDLSVVTVPFPSEQVDLSAKIQSLDAIAQPDHHPKFLRALELLEPALDGVVAELRPDVVVIDVFFVWAPDLAAKHGVPWLAFWGTGFCAMCCMDTVARLRPFELVSSDDEPFVLPGLPDRFELVRTQLPNSFNLAGAESEFTKIIEKVSKAAEKSQGIVVNSFYELEPAYADHYRSVLGKKAWHVGPVSLCRTKDVTPQINGHACLKWLDTKPVDSVVFMCFGTNATFSDEQLREIAGGLEASGQGFMWVVARKGDDSEGCGWLPEGFEERMKGRGMIIRGWAPQVLILDHRSVGAFVTHCGWNSVLEGLSAGVPLVTWPIFAEQFYNEKLIVQVLGTGVGVGTKKWVPLVGDFVKAEQVSQAVSEVMVGEGSGPMRARAKALGEAARRAVMEGGSSYSDLGNLIEFVKSTKKNRP